MNHIDQFWDLLVVPYTYLLDASRGFAHTKGGPIWPDWENSIHRHHKGGKPIDWVPEYDETEPQMQAGEAWWAGACCHHFGHQIVDFSSKLALYSEILGPNDRIAVATKIGSGMDSYEALPGFARSIYDYFGFGAARIHVVSQPTRFALLHSIPQQEQHGGTPASETHLLALIRCAERRLHSGKWAGGRFYISRAQMAHGGGIAGEKALERKIEQADYQVIYPEQMSLRDQLELYNSAAELVFQEGSALHGLQLLGRIGAKVTVLVRRPGFKMLEPNLRQRVSDLNYVSVGNTFLHGIKPNGKPADANGILVPDEDGLNRLADTLGADLPEFSRIDADLETDIADSVRGFLKRETKSHRAKNPEHMRRIGAQLKKTQLAGIATEFSTNGN